MVEKTQARLLFETISHRHHLSRRAFERSAILIWYLPVGLLDQRRSIMDQRPAFKTTRISNQAFRIEEYDDVYQEHPFIYAKVLPTLIVLVDTGCGGATTNPTINLTSLRRFLEIYPIRENQDMPLNPAGQKKYVVVCTHCHYDHICTWFYYLNCEIG